MELGTEADWAKHVIKIRNSLNLSQEEFAEQLQTIQCTVSRWERGVTTPNYRMRKKLKLLGKELLVVSKIDRKTIAEIARGILESIPGRHPFILARDHTIIAASARNPYGDGKLLEEVALKHQQKEIHDLYAFFDEIDFWNTKNACFKHSYKSRAKVNSPEKTVTFICTSIDIGGEIFCLIHGKSKTVPLSDDFGMVN